MWEPGHWKASGLQVLDSVMTTWKKLHHVSFFCCVQSGETLTLVGAPVASLTAFLVLIRTVAAVIGTVTHPVGGDATVVCTLELGGCTKFVCKGCQKEFI